MQVPHANFPEKNAFFQQKTEKKTVPLRRQRIDKTHGLWYNKAFIYSPKMPADTSAPRKKG